MSIPNSLLAMLAERPMYGAELKSEFERRTGGTWPLNVGQVYTTLSRLERDGLVVPSGEPDGEGRITYGLTTAGAAQALRWWSEPVAREGAPRSELAIKIALAVTAPGVDVASVLQVQRRATIAHLQDLTRLKRGERADADVAWLLVLEHLIFTAEAEARWLDHVETSLARTPRSTPPPIAPPPVTPPTVTEPADPHRAADPAPAGSRELS